MRYLKYISIAIAVLLVHYTSAQDYQNLDLSQALEIAGAKSLTIQMQQLKEELALAEYDLEKNWWLPTVDAGINLHQLWGNVMNGDGRIFTDVDRQNFGAAIGLNSEIDFASGKRNKKLKEYEAKGRVIQSQIERNDQLLEVVRSYYQAKLAQVKALSYAALINQNDSIINQLEVLVREGLHYNTDLLLAKANRENHKYEKHSARKDYIQRISDLALLLNAPIAEVLTLDESSLVLIDLITSTDEASLADAPIFQYLSLQQESQEYEYKSVKNGIWAPKLKLGAYTSMFGDVFTEIAPTHGLNGAVSWQIPFTRFTGDDMKVLDIEKTILDQEVAILKMQQNQSVDQITKEFTIIKEQVTASKSAVGNASQALDESIQRQQLGLARAFEIEIAQEAFVKSRINYFSAIVEYNILQYEYFVLLGNDL